MHLMPFSSNNRKMCEFSPEGDCSQAPNLHCRMNIMRILVLEYPHWQASSSPELSHHKIATERLLACTFFCQISANCSETRSADLLWSLLGAHTALKCIFTQRLLKSNDHDITKDGLCSSTWCSICCLFVCSFVCCLPESSRWLLLAHLLRSFVACCARCPWRGGRRRRKLRKDWSKSKSTRWLLVCRVDFSDAHTTALEGLFERDLYSK